MSVLAVIIIILAVFAVILLIPVRVNLFFVLENRGVFNDYELKYGLIRIKNRRKRKKKAKSSDKPGYDETKKDISALELLKFLKDNVKRIKDLVLSLVKYGTKKLIRIERISIKAELGSDDAMQTALLYGATSAFLYEALGILDKCVATDGIRVDYKPVFGNAEIFVELKCIIKTSLYKVICFAAIGFIKAIPLIKKRGDLKNGKSD